MSQRCYFAYGQHMATAMMGGCVAGAHLVGRGQLREWALSLDHMGADGSAKANLRRDPGAEVWGVIYRLPAGGLAALDAALLGYRRVELDPVDDAGAVRPCTAHLSDIVDETWTAVDVYRDQLVAGAREHALPETYVEALEALPAKPGRLPGCGGR
jgi:hypothetical protein